MIISFNTKWQIYHKSWNIKIIENKDNQFLSMQQNWQIWHILWNTEIIENKDYQLLTMQQKMTNLPQIMKYWKMRICCHNDCSNNKKPYQYYSDGLKDNRPAVQWFKSRQVTFYHWSIVAFIVCQL